MGLTWDQKLRHGRRDGAVVQENSDENPAVMMCRRRELVERVKMPERGRKARW